MTLVEDATHVANEAVIGTESAGGFEFYGNCDLGSIDAICTEIGANEQATTTVTYSGPYELVDVPIGTDTALATTATATASITFSASSEPVLPPSIPVRNTQPTVTSTGSSAPSSTLAPGTGSGAVKNAFVGLGVGVVGPAVLALLVTLRIWSDSLIVMGLF